MPLYKVLQVFFPKIKTNNEFIVEEELWHTNLNRLRWHTQLEWVVLPEHLSTLREPWWYIPSWCMMVSLSVTMGIPSAPGAFPAPQMLLFELFAMKNHFVADAAILHHTKLLPPLIIIFITIWAWMLIKASSGWISKRHKVYLKVLNTGSFFLSLHF